MCLLLLFKQTIYVDTYLILYNMYEIKNNFFDTFGMKHLIRKFVEFCNGKCGLGVISI